jgi:hypothetical protein
MSRHNQNPAVSQSDAKDECRMYHVIRVEVCANITVGMATADTGIIAVKYSQATLK